MKTFIKRVVSVAVCVVILICTLAVAPFATDADIAISFDRAGYIQGETVVAQVYFPKSFDKVAALDMVLTYDSSKLELESLTMGEDFYDAYNSQINGKAFSVNYDNPGIVDWALVGSNNFKFSGVFAEIVFNINKNAEIGDSEITITVENAANSGYVNVTDSIVVEGGIVTIGQNLSNYMTLELNESKTGYIVTNYRNIKDTDVVIPEIYDGLPIVEIGDSAFKDHAEIESISLPKTITKIGYRAFTSCNKLTSIELPEVMTEIADNAFMSCMALKQVKMPIILEKIGKQAFYQCYSLESVILPFTLKSIGSYAFSQCYNMKTVTISKNTAIGENAFLNCSALSKFITVADNENLVNYLNDSGINCEIEYRKDISLGTAIAEDTKFTGEAVTAPVSVELTSGDEVTADTDYKLLYIDNIDIGEARCYLYGIGDYLEGYILDFNIFCEHDFTETVLREATCSNNGMVSCKCSVCGYETRKLTDMLPHQSEKWVYDVRPTVFSTGVKHKVCNECGNIFETDTVADKLFPDVDGDGNVTSIDALMVLSYSVGKTGAIRGNERLFNADTNADGNINAIDALNILRVSVGLIEQ